MRMIVWIILALFFDLLGLIGVASCFAGSVYIAPHDFQLYFLLHFCEWILHNSLLQVFGSASKAVGNATAEGIEMLCGVGKFCKRRENGRN